MWHLLADVHLDLKTLPRLQSFFNFYFDRFARTRPRHVIFLGDTFNVRTGTDAHLHRVFSEYLQRLLDAPHSPQVHLLVGNHDMKNRHQRADNALYPFSLLRGRVKVYHEITQTHMDGHAAVFIPYHHDETQVAQYIKTQPPNDIQSTIAFFHGSFKGAISNGASDNSHAICHDSVINSTNLGCYRRAFLGHFHTHGFPSWPSKVMYVGSPIQSNMGDAGDLNHGYVEYDPLEDSCNLVRNPEAEYYITMSWQESFQNAQRVRGKKVRLIVDATHRAEIAQRKDAVQRHIDDLYHKHEAHFVELRYSSQPLPEADRSESVHNANTELQLYYDALPAVPSISSLVQSFLNDNRQDGGSDDLLENLKTKEWTLTCETYLLSIIHEYHQQHGMATPATTFYADLSRIEMINFRGILGTAVFDLDALTRGTVFLVASSNGSGKSTLLEAVMWCLYGEFLDPDIRAEEALHSGQRTCSVSLHFRNGYTFTRSRTGTRPKFEIFHHGALVEHGHDAKRNTQYLESHILQTSSDLLRRTILLADHATSALLSMRDARRGHGLDSVFGLNLLKEYRSCLEVASKASRSRWTQINYECEKLGENVTTLANVCRKRAKEHEDLNATMRQKEQLIDDMKRRSDSCQSALRRKQGEIKTKMDIVTRLDVELSRLEHQLKICQTRGDIKTTQEQIGNCLSAMATEQERQRQSWIQERERRSFLFKVTRQHLVPLIDRIACKSAQSAWPNQFFMPFVHALLRLLITWTSPPQMTSSRDALRTLEEALQRKQACLHLLIANVPIDTNKQSSPEHLETLILGRDENQKDRNLDRYSLQSNLYGLGYEAQLDNNHHWMREIQKSLKIKEERQAETRNLLGIDREKELLLRQETDQISLDIAHHSGQLDQLVHRASSLSSEIGDLMQQQKALLQDQENSQKRRTAIESEVAISSFWMAQLQDTATVTGPFITYCRTNYVQSFNAIIAEVSEQLSLDAEGLPTQRLDFQLLPDYSIEPINGALSMGKRSKGQKTRTYLALFLAMFQLSRARLPLRTSFVFLDEVMDAVDLAGMEALQRWLGNYAAARDMQIFMLTHREANLHGNVIDVARDHKGHTSYRLRRDDV